MTPRPPFINFIKNRRNGTWCLPLVQLVQLCIVSSRQFEDPFENTQQRKCDFASYQVSTLRTYLKTHNGEKSNKCYQCDYASSQAIHLRIHSKTHSGQHSKKCNQCDFASYKASNLRTHLNFQILTTFGQNKCNQLAYKHFLRQAIKGDT